MTEQLIRQIRAWLRDFDDTRADDGESGEVENDTFEGSAYILFNRILKEENLKVKNKKL